MFDKITPPQDGEKLSYNNDGKLEVGHHPIIPFIEGDGIGPDIWKATQLVLDQAIAKAYGNERRIAWMEIYAGEKAQEKYSEWLPNDTIEAIREFKVAIKGPLTTPVGGGYRSLNVSLRQILDLYACIRPVRYFDGVPSPMKNPGLLNVVIFRENTEDVYAGYEWAEGDAKTKKLLAFLKSELAVDLRQDSGIGIKPVSITGTKRLVRKAIEYAIEHKRSSVTLVHKGNIMKFTEGAFRDWGYQLAADDFAEQTISEQDVWDKHDGKVPAGKIVIKDRIADNMFQQILIKADDYDVIATTNLNGDYLSDATAAQVGGLGIAPGANIGDTVALFEATHGTAPKYANLDKINPSSLILSGVLMLEHLGWQEAADLVVKGIQASIAAKKVTYDLARGLEGATELKCSQYAQSIVDYM